MILQRAGVARPVHPCVDQSLSVAALREGVILGVEGKARGQAQL